MNEQLKDFLKKASEDESIKDELKALEGLSAEENAEQAAAIAQKAGFDLSAEDFAPSSAELDEDELGAVAGGEACCCQYTGLGLVDDRGAVCECPTTGTGIRRDTGEICEITSICRFMGEKNRRPSPLAKPVSGDGRRRRVSWALRRWSVLIR